MIRLVLILSLFTIFGSSSLPKLRARFTLPFHAYCLKNTPSAQHKSEIQSLVCGSSLKNLSEQQDWKNLGLIHILVVSGGHLSILASLLMHMHRVPRRLATANQARLHPLIMFSIAVMLILFCLANRLQPPVLRSLVEWLIRSRLSSRGWRPAEISLVSTWIALPFSSTIFDLLSLALSFFASVAVQQTSKALHRRPILQAISLQISVWWVLLPLLFTMGFPHPLTTMVNVVLAPVLGATLIPLAMLTWSSHIMPPLLGESNDPVLLGVLFDSTWRKLAIGIQWLAAELPSASPRIKGVQPLLLGPERTSTLILGLMCATCAILIRSRREVRRESIKKSRLKPFMISLGAIVIAVLVHRELSKLAG